MTIHPLLCNTCTIIPCDQIPYFFQRIVFRIFKFLKLLQLTGKTPLKNKEIEQGYPEMGRGPIEIKQFLFKCHQFSAIYLKSGNFKIELVLNLKKQLNLRIILM